MGSCRRVGGGGGGGLPGRDLLHEGIHIIIFAAGKASSFLICLSEAEGGTKGERIQKD